MGLWKAPINLKMSNNVIILENNQIEKISQILGDILTGSKISQILSQMNEVDTSGQSTKWRRVYFIFTKITNETGSSNAFLRFIKIALSPIDFVNNNETFERTRLRINEILAFSGLVYEKNGIFKITSCANTIDEVYARLNSLKSKLCERNVHSEILKYCKEELLTDNYFHAIFEASKSLCEKIRCLTGLTLDGSELIEQAFSTKHPYLKINQLKTDTDRNQQNGLMLMLKGINSMVRNVTAHTPKIKWIINEDDATDVLLIISFLHKRIDECIIVRTEEK